MRLRRVIIEERVTNAVYARRALRGLMGDITTIFGNKFWLRSWLLVAEQTLS